MNPYSGPGPRRMGASTMTLAGPTAATSATGMGVTFGSIVGSAATSAAGAAESSGGAAPSGVVGTVPLACAARSGAVGPLTASATGLDRASCHCGTCPPPGQALSVDSVSAPERDRPQEGCLGAAASTAGSVRVDRGGQCRIEFRRASTGTVSSVSSRGRVGGPSPQQPQIPEGLSRPAPSRRASNRRGLRP